jgi:hypothetical protein
MSVNTRALTASIALLAGSIWSSACANGLESRERTFAETPPASSAVIVEDHPALIATFPCSSCHKDLEPNPRQRKLTEYHTPKNGFEHGTKIGWCYRCHSQDDIDKLHTPHGEPVAFSDPQELCGSCHGDKLIDWKLGLHGLNRGSWNGPKLRRSCTFCHDPHKPAFEPMVPERPPDVLGPNAPNREPKT